MQSFLIKDAGMFFNGIGWNTLSHTRITKEFFAIF